MNQMSGTGVPPTMPMSSGPKPFFQVWMDALTKPSEATFAELAASPNAKSSTAYLWVFVGFLIEFFLSFLVPQRALGSMLSQYGIDTGQQVGGGFASTAIRLVCGAPILALIGTIFFAIGVVLVQWIAKMFGGRGTSAQLAYAWAAFAAPYSIVAGVFSLLAAIPFVGLCFSILLFVFSIYIIVLEVIAVKGVNQFGWGAALGAVFIPGLVIGLLCACIVGVMIFALGPAIGNAFSTINQSLTAP
ncbi:MAG: YIP1 family protein [Chloroflexi bacterium]|nr:YIP1 family protein [Chloroflexota bacterium]